MNLIFVSKNYNIFQALSSKCENILVHQLNLSNALGLFQLAYLHRGQVLKQASLEFIASNFDKIEKNREWEALKQDPSGLLARVEVMKYIDNQWNCFFTVQKNPKNLHISTSLRSAHSRFEYSTGNLVLLEPSLWQTIFSSESLTNLFQNIFSNSII